MVNEIGLFAAGPLANIGKSIFQAGGFRSSAGIRGANPSLFEKFSTFFKPKPLPRLQLPKVSGGTKALAGLTVGTAGVISTEAFLTTPQGQQTLETIEDVGDQTVGIINNTTDFFNQNPIILPLLLGVGAIVLLK